MIGEVPPGKEKQMNEKLRKRVEEKHAGVPFMADREKGDFADLEGFTITLDSAAYITKDGEGFWAFTCVEFPENFFFANGRLGSILDDANDIAADDHVPIENVLKDCKVTIGSLTVNLKTKRSYRPVDIV